MNKIFIDKKIGLLRVLCESLTRGVYDFGFVNFATASSNSKVASPVGFIPLYLENSISVSLPQVGQIFVDDLFVNVSSCSKHSSEIRMLNCLFKGASPPSL